MKILGKTRAGKQWFPRNLPYLFFKISQDFHFFFLYAGEFIFPKAVQSISPTSSIQRVNRSRRSLTGFSDCVFLSGSHPCILKPFLKNILTITVLSESSSKREYRVHLQAAEGSIVYLPCNTLYELQNEVIIRMLSV